MDQMTDEDLETAAQGAMRANDPARAWPLLEEIDRRQAAARARLARPEALAAAALWYARAGIAVFPLRVKGKAPLLRAAHPAGSRERADCQGECGKPGHGLYDATTDTDVVTAWWRRTPEANIGLRTGLRYDVIDVDGPAGYASLARLEAAGAVPRVAQAFTPGNQGADPPRPPGAHIYVPATGDGCAAGIAPGLDYRGVGGYVVAPPSHGPSNRQYTWAIPLAGPA